MSNSTDRFQQAKSALAGLGKRLRDARGVRTQEEMAQELGVPRQQYARYETGRTPDPLHLIHIARILKISLDDLVLGATAARHLPRPADLQVHPPVSGDEMTDEMFKDADRKLWRIFKRRGVNPLAWRKVMDELEFWVNQTSEVELEADARQDEERPPKRRRRKQ